MNIKIHTTGGQSFKDLAAYLLEDKNEQLSDRVAWTETRNIATNNPQAAWRVMAATAMNQKALKRDAGISPGGRKPGGSVLHMSVSWKDEEAKDRGLTREGMMKLVDTVLANYGAVKPKRAQFANEHQALIVCHRDKNHPHVHVVVNRTHPEHGVYLPDGNDWLKMSGSALQYERESGRIWSPKREINWDNRNRQKLAHYQEKPRNMWQAQQDGAHPERLDKAAAEQKRKDFALYREGRNLKKKHQGRWQLLSRQHQERVSQIESETRRKAGQAITQIRKDFQEDWTKRLHQKEEAYRDFLINENSFIGRMKNRVEAIDFRKIFTPRDRAQSLAQVGEIISSPAARQKSFVSKQKKLDRNIERDQTCCEQKAMHSATKARTQSLRENRDRFQRDRLSLIETQGSEKTKLRLRWKLRNQERASALQSPDLKVPDKLAQSIESLRRIQARYASHAQQQQRIQLGKR